jgi:hypothetical protein
MRTVAKAVLPIFGGIGLRGLRWLCGPLWRSVMSICDG